MSAILALDQGTTSSRALVFDHAGRMLSAAQQEFGQLYPQPGWVEHDPEEIWSTQLAVAKQAMERSGVPIEAIGIANQRETTVIWDRKSGETIYPAIVWQDRRTAARCDELRADDTIGALTGLVADSYFSATKLKWILDNVPRARQRAEAGELAFGTIDSFLLWRLTEGKVHATDVSNASRTMLFDIHRVEWSTELLERFRIPRCVLPEVLPSSALYSTSSILGPPICGIAGDQQAATFGQACYREGMVKATYGTGCFLLMNTGAKVRTSTNRLLSTVGWQLTDATTYALEGSVFVAGAAVQWLRDGLGIIADSGETEALAQSVPDSGGVVMVPAFTGLGAPYWDPHARGTILGITRGTARAHIVRATLESIAFQCRDVLEAMADDCGFVIPELRVDGGASRNNFLMQFQADILGIPVVRPKNTETTALGAAFLAGLTCGIWHSPEELERVCEDDRVFEPSMSPEGRAALCGTWRKAVERSRAWA